MRTIQHSTVSKARFVRHLGLVGTLAMLALVQRVSAGPPEQAAGSDSGSRAAVEPSSTDDRSDSAEAGLELMMKRSVERVAAANALPELTGSGPYPALLEVDLALPNATIYRPAILGRLGRRKLGVLIWGNGGCSNDGASARAHLAQIASHGYLVIAPGRPLTGPATAPGAPAPELMKTTIQDLRSALDWVLAENDREGSPYFGLIDPKAAAVAGHSCGGMQAILLADDRRIQTAIVHNSGIFPLLPDNPPLVMHDERLKGLRHSVLFVLGGQSDIAWKFGKESFGRIGAIPAVLASRELGHGGTFSQPHGGEVAKIAVDWLEWQLRSSKDAAATFVGADCGLCRDQAWTIEKKGVP